MAITANTIFCDDARLEASGKHILIGVYDGELQLNNGPATIPLSLWIQIFGLSAGDHSFEMIAKKHDDGMASEIAKAQGEISIPEMRHGIAVTLPGLPIHVDRDCSLRISLRVDEAPPIQVGSLSIIAAFLKSKH